MSPSANVHTALCEFQKNPPRITKDREAKVKSDKASYSYSFANLADIQHAALPLLAAQGLDWSAQPTINHLGVFVLAYQLTHGASDTAIAGEYPLADPTRITPQQAGSNQTYATRRAFQAVTGIAPDDDTDDDGARASGYDPDQDVWGSAKPAATREPVLTMAAAQAAEEGLRGDIDIAAAVEGDARKSALTREWHRINVAGKDGRIDAAGVQRLKDYWTHKRDEKVITVADVSGGPDEPDAAEIAAAHGVDAYGN